MRVSWAVGAFSRKCSRRDRAPEKRKLFSNDPHWHHPLAPGIPATGGGPSFRAGRTAIDPQGAFLVVGLGTPYIDYYVAATQLWLVFAGPLIMDRDHPFWLRSQLGNDRTGCLVDGCSLLRAKARSRRLSRDRSVRAAVSAFAGSSSTARLTLVPSVKRKNPGTAQEELVRFRTLDK